MTSPKVSVVIITYNRPDRISGAIETVLNQSYQDFEIIVVDGANSDKNKEQVLLYKDSRIKYVPVEPEAVNYISYKGIQHSRNVGCKTAKGEYIAMLDDDDKWHVDKLKKQVEILNSNPKVGLVLCYTAIKMGETIVIDKTKESPTYLDLLQSYNLSSTSTYLIRTDILRSIGYWNESLRGMHEYDIALKLSRCCWAIYTVPEPLMLRDRISNITVESGHYYFFKIAEIFDLWHYYGKDFLKNIGVKGFIFNAIKTVSLVSLFTLGYIVKERIWSIIYPLKKLHEKVVS